MKKKMMMKKMMMKMMIMKMNLMNEFLVLCQASKNFSISLKLMQVTSEAGPPLQEIPLAKPELFLTWLLA